VYFTHRLDSDGHHIAYDPRQTRVVMERQFLGIYATLAFATPTERQSSGHAGDLGDRP